MARLSKQVIDEEVGKLRSMVETGEILKYSTRDLAKKLKFSKNTISKHLNEIKEEIGTRDIKVISLRLMNILDNMMEDLEKFWMKAREDGDEQKCMYYMKQMFHAIEKFTDFLERFNIKPKAIDNIAIQAELTQKHVHVQIIDDRSQVIQDGTSSNK
jgi:hypothetical protein